MKKQCTKIKTPNTSNGITLIALIVTIVLMLILATITVNVVIDGGLFEYAGNAKDATEIASEKDTVQKAVILAESLSKTGRITVEEIQNAINKITSESTAKVMSFGDDIYVKFDNSQRYYEIDNNKKVEGPIEIEGDETPGALDGTGTENDPYVIMSIEDLVYISQQTNETHNTYANKYIILGKSLDFESELSYENYTTTEYDEYLGGDGSTGLKEQLTNGNGFRPIGVIPNYSFKGNFNGNNNTIYNLKVDSDGESAGLFGKAYSAYISNIIVTGSIVARDGANVGGIVGLLQGLSVVTNCYNFCDICCENNGYAGGIAGSVALGCVIVNSYNNGNVKLEADSSYVSAGGIVGTGDIVLNCCNLGTVENYCTKVYAGAGGIIGNQVNTAKTILNCYNVGKVTGQYSQGAIVGGYWYSTWLSTLENCYYLESSCDCPVKEEGDVTEGTISCTREYMQSEEFINELNAYVDTYNEEHKEDEDFIELKKWRKATNSYPELINE